MNEELSSHYYGDSMRILFVISGLIMVVSYPFFASFISIPIPLAILGCIILAVFGGLMNPKQKWIMVLNVFVSVSAFIVFEYFAIFTYLNLSPKDNMHVAFFWVNQLLALLFFFASYLSTKTLRGSLVV